MRWFLLTTMLLAAAISFATQSATTLAAPHPPFRSADLTVSAPHPLVGSWVETTTAGPVPMVFGADGSVTMQFPDVALSNQGNSFIGGGVGTWEPVGTHGAAYSVVRLVSHANGIDLGTITIQGYLVLSTDGTTFSDDGQLTVLTARNAQGAISSITGVSADAPASIATRTLAAPAAHFEAHGANAIRIDAAPVERTVPVRHGGGCPTCR